VSDLFEKLEPPVGGLARLRERLAREHERRLPRAIWVGGLISGLAAAAVVAAGPWAWRRRPSARPRAPAAVESAATIVTRLPSSNPKVVLFAVASTQGLTASPGDEPVARAR